MDLFYVRRFYEDEDEEKGTTNIEIEKERLRSLKQKIKLKRKEFVSEVSVERVSEGGYDFNKQNYGGISDSTKKEKKIKRKRSSSEIKAPAEKHVKQGTESVDKLKYDDSNNANRRKREDEELINEKRRNKENDMKSPINLEKGKSKMSIDDTSKEGMKIVQEEYVPKMKKKKKSKEEKQARLMSNATPPEKKAKNKVSLENSSVKIQTNGKDRDNRTSGAYDSDDEESSEQTAIVEASEGNKIESQEEDFKGKIEDKSLFKILGSFDTKKEKQIVKRLLPKWINEARYIESDVESSRLSINDASFLEKFVKENLKQQNIDSLFPVQSCVIPYIMSQSCKRGVFHKIGLLPSDICVSAPTGSGKTLAYVIPILQIISKCEYRRLQAVIILPSRDLASQVKTVISNYTSGTHIKVGLASGVKSFHDEQLQIVSTGPHGSVSNIDILVCTPGRLVDHISSTDGFSLEHLRFLVIDEADRLLGQSYHNWLEKILDAVYKSSKIDLDSRRGSSFRSIISNATPSMAFQTQLPLQKLLFSATMTHNPEKLAPLKLYKPVLFQSIGPLRVQENNDGSDRDESTTNERYVLPESLEQKMTVCEQSEKPLVIIYLMRTLNCKRVLCFTGSIESTHRLSLLVRECGIKAAGFSSVLNQTQRKGILRDFKNGDVDLLICSDSMSRGMDIENVDFVVSYDPPVNMKTYVHRVGRTARAGNKGTAVTVLSSKEVYHFKKMLADNGNAEKMKKMNIPKKHFKPLLDEYESALSLLKNVVISESNQTRR